MKTANVLCVCWTLVLLPVLHGQVGQQHNSLLFVMLDVAGEPFQRYLIWAPVYAFAVWAAGCALIHALFFLFRPRARD